MGTVKGYAHKDCDGEISQDMFIESVTWVKTSYERGPLVRGEYYVSDGDGKVYTLQCTGISCRGDNIFYDVVMRFSRSEAVWDDQDRTKLTDSELIEVYRTNCIWYESEDIYDYDNCPDGVRYIIHQKPPKYYLVSDLTGPVDSENYGEPIVTSDINEYHSALMEFKGSRAASDYVRDLVGNLFEDPYE